MCVDLGVLSVVSGKEFLKLVQILVDSGVCYGVFLVIEILGNFNILVLKYLLCMYNQVKVKVICVLGSNVCLGIGVICYFQSVGFDFCYIFMVYQVEGNYIKSYVLGVKGVDICDSGDFVYYWVQNVLLEFVMLEIRIVYVMDCWVSMFVFFKVGMCFCCLVCVLNLVVQSVLSKWMLQVCSMYEVIELFNVCEDLVGFMGLVKEIFGLLEEMLLLFCWNLVMDLLLLVYECYEQICEFYSWVKKMNFIQSFNKYLFSNLVVILMLVKQVVIELSNESQFILQFVLFIYVRLEKLFMVKVNDVGIVSKFCYFFLEVFKENFKVYLVYKVVMILDLQQKLWFVLFYQYEEIIGKVCEFINEVKEFWVEEVDFEFVVKKFCFVVGENFVVQEDDWLGKNEVYDYLQEFLFQVIFDFFQYWLCVI